MHKKKRQTREKCTCSTGGGESPGPESAREPLDEGLVVVAAAISEYPAAARSGSIRAMGWAGGGGRRGTAPGA